jgi:hypothetical protein
VGVTAAIAASLIPHPWSPFAGFTYIVIGPLIAIGGIILVPKAKPQPRPGM